MKLVLQPSYRVEGPPPGLARGRWEVDRTIIAILGAAILVLGLAYFFTRIYRRKKAE